MSYAAGSAGCRKEEKMKQFTYVLKDPMGIHARPASLFVRTAAQFPCSVKIENKGKTVDAKRIIGVMTLCAKCGEAITIQTEGEKEEEAGCALEKFLTENL